MTPHTMEASAPPLFLAPMAGVTDLAYRILARECGADLTVTEFTAASGLTRKNTYSWLKVESDPRESPFIPQILGASRRRWSRQSRCCRTGPTS